MFLRTLRLGAGLACIAGLTACSVYSPFLPSSGPDARRVIEGAGEEPALGIQVVDLTDAVLRRVVTNQQRQGVCRRVRQRICRRHGDRAR